MAPIRTQLQYTIINHLCVNQFIFFHSSSDYYDLLLSRYQHHKSRKYETRPLLMFFC